METKKSISGSGIFTPKVRHIINRKAKPCIFSQKLKPNLTKYLFDFFYYRELYNLGSINLFFYQCFSDYQLLTWNIEMNNIIDIFHLDIKNYEDEVDDTLTKCIKNKRTYKMKDHPGCYIRINKDGTNIISLAYYDNSVQKNLKEFNKNNTVGEKKKLNMDIINDKLAKLSLNPNNDYDSSNTIFNISEPPSNLGSGDIISSKISEPHIWNTKYLEGSYITNSPCINLIKTTPLNFGFSFYHIIKGDYQLYLNQCLLNMINAQINIQVFINNYNIYTEKKFPKDILIEQYGGNQNENEKNIKLKEYLICSITAKMFEDADNNENTIEDFNSPKDYEIRVVFTNQNLFWKSGWFIDGGRLLKKVYEINDNKYKKYKSGTIEFTGTPKFEENKEIKLRGMKNQKRNSVGNIDNIPNIYS